MTERFNVPPGWPVPSGWTPPAGWEPDPSWPSAPPGWQFWVEDTAAPTISVNRPDATAGKRLAILGAAGVVVLVVLVGAVVMFLHSHGKRVAPENVDGATQQSETWKTLPSSAPADSPAVLPAGAFVCGVRPGGKYQGAARGTETTSCPFVENVRDALNNAGGQVPSVVDAYSPTTGMHYQMTCVMEQVVTCRGGKNAVVYVYKEPTAATVPASDVLPSDDAIFDALRRSGVSSEDLSRYAIVSKAAPTPGWYVAEIRRTDIQLEHAHAIFRGNTPPDGHLVTVAGPGTNFPGVVVPDEVRQALPAGMIS